MFEAADVTGSTSGAWDREVVAAAVRMQLVEPHVPVIVSSIAPGVSSDVWLVRSESSVFVMKRALATLRTLEHWTAPLVRSRYEAQWLSFARTAAPGFAPRLLGYDPDSHMLAMEFHPPDSHQRWKEQLLGGRAEPIVAAGLASGLVRTHAVSSATPEVRRRFDARDVLLATRIDTYFLWTADRHPEVAPALRQVASKILSCDTCVIHGDVSPKNVLVADCRPVLLDAECSCIGDPAFDVAFLLTHLCLKALYRPESLAGFQLCANTFLKAYIAGVTWEDPEGLEGRAGELLAALMLARVVGKVPVEYLDADQASDVRTFCIRLMRHATPDVTTVMRQWMGYVSSVVSSRSRH